jgi:hypothetical protein
MKKEIKPLIALVLFSLFACKNIACSVKSDSDRSVNTADELKAYLDKQTANSPDNPIKIAIKANDKMLDKIRKVLDESEIYVNLDFSKSSIKIIRGLSGSKNLVKITIPESITSIDNDAFGFCTNLASITIPNSVTSIGEMAFICCKSLASITIPDSVTSIGDCAFILCKSLASITIPNSVTSIESQAFNGCSSLTSIKIPNSVTRIGYDAFISCSKLDSVTLGNGITSIEEQTFYACSSLTSITIPNSITNIGIAAFGACTSLTSVTFQSTIPSSGFNSGSIDYPTFPGDLRDKFYAIDPDNGTPGTYTRASGGETWTRQ